MTHSNLPAIELINCNGGNLGSVKRALERLKIPFTIVNQSQKISGNAPLILPGVGAFGAFMHHLSSQGLTDSLRQAVAQGTPLLGICVGLQVLFESSTEAYQNQSPVAGLGLISGHIVQFDTRMAKVPQIGWNRIEPNLKAFPTGHWPQGNVYFVNSFYAQPTTDACVLYRAHYAGQNFCAAVQQQNMTAFQFHPEKSGAMGHQLLQQWYQEAVQQ